MVSDRRVERPHRWVLDEPDIPFDMPILYEDSRIIVVDKPHFLASTPRGMWYRSTALIRLREMTGEPDIIPAHRLDRATAGVLVFIRDRRYRGKYQMLFQNRQVHKEYECLSPAKPLKQPRFGTVKPLNPPSVFPLLRSSRILKHRGILQAYEERGSVNAKTIVDLATEQPPEQTQGGYRKYSLRPLTGKTHQLRVHMNSIGIPIKYDNLYPSLRDDAEDDFGKPLALVARSLSFIDPVSKEERHFISQMPLSLT